MNNVKEFCKKHKKGIILTGVVVGAVVTGLLIKGRSKKTLIDITDKCAVTWRPSGRFINLERVKELLDLNAGNAESFAIVRDPGNVSDAYSFILLSENVITSKPV